MIFSENQRFFESHRKHGEFGFKADTEIQEKSVKQTTEKNAKNTLKTRTRRKKKKKTQKVLMGKFRKYLSGLGNISFTIGQRGIFEKK